MPVAARAGHVRVYQYDEALAEKWVQLGSDLDGEAAGDHSGQSVSMSADGSVLAIGASANDGNGDNAGHVRIYEYDDSAPQKWVQVGSDIDGPAQADTGTTLMYQNATGATGGSPLTLTDAQMTGWNGWTLDNDWALLFKLDQSSVYDGTVFRFHATPNLTTNNFVRFQRISQSNFEVVWSFMNAAGTGSAKIYFNIPISSTYHSGPADIQFLLSYNKTNYSYSGGSGGDSDPPFSTSSNGPGLSLYYRTSSDGGTSYSAWTQHTSVSTDTLDEDTPITWPADMTATFGAADSSGASNLRNGSAQPAGAVTDIYMYNQTLTTSQVGLSESELAATSSRHSQSCGWSVALSADGTRVALGAHGHDTTDGTDAGCVRVFQRSSDLAGKWEQLGADIKGSSADAYFGMSLALSDDGTVVAAGEAPGKVRMFEYDGEWHSVVEVDDGTGTSETGQWLALRGGRLAVGAWMHDGSNGTASGRVRVYKILSNSPPTVGFASGSALALTDDGAQLAMHLNNSVDGSFMRVFKAESSGWEQLGPDLTTTGGAMHMSSDGTRLFATILPPPPTGNTPYRYWGLSNRDGTFVIHGDNTYRFRWVTFADAEGTILNDDTYYSPMRGGYAFGKVKNVEHAAATSDYFNLLSFSGTDEYHTNEYKIDPANPSTGNWYGFETWDGSNPLIYVDLGEAKDVRQVVHCIGNGNTFATHMVVASNGLATWTVVHEEGPDPSDGSASERHEPNATSAPIYTRTLSIPGPSGPPRSQAALA